MAMYPGMVGTAVGLGVRGGVRAGWQKVGLADDRGSVWAVDSWTGVAMTAFVCGKRAAVQRSLPV